MVFTFALANDADGPCRQRVRRCQLNFSTPHFACSAPILESYEPAHLDWPVFLLQVAQFETVVPMMMTAHLLYFRQG